MIFDNEKKLNYSELSYCILVTFILKMILPNYTVILNIKIERHSEKVIFFGRLLKKIMFLFVLKNYLFSFILSIFQITFIKKS